jgi:hypothetical protein
MRLPTAFCKVQMKELVSAAAGPDGNVTAYL